MRTAQQRKQASVGTGWPVVPMLLSGMHAFEDTHEHYAQGTPVSAGSRLFASPPFLFALPVIL